MHAVGVGIISMSTPVQGHGGCSVVGDIEIQRVKRKTADELMTSKQIDSGSKLHTQRVIFLPQLNSEHRFCRICI